MVAGRMPQPAPRSEIIHVLLVDEREAMRAGLRQMLSENDDIHVIGEAGDGREALARARSLRPDIVLIDAGVRGTTGIDIARAIHRSHLAAGIIILADNQKLLAPAIEAGAVGFLPRNISRSHLAAAIRVIHLWRLGLFRQRNHFALVKL